ncbi:hypothetical protein KBD81_01955 [Candidatus Woesebacteria bacterium]|nr:hypothetical protein [Candidatus Woesebacteria bacterium]
MDNQKIRHNIPAVQELLANADSVGIVVTEHQTLDKVAGALALMLSLKSAGKNVQVASHRDPIVEISNLVGIDKVKRSFDGIAKKLVVSLPYIEGEVEKVSYNIEGNRLNINLFAAKDKGISFTEKDVDYIRSGAAPQVIFTIGIRKMEEMGSLVSSENEVKIIRLDTVTPQNDFGDVSFADSSFSSISEIIVGMIQELRLPVDVDIAQNLMDGVVAATNNFTSQKTSPAAFASAAYLLSHNATRQVQKQDTQEEMLSTRRPSKQPRVAENPIDSLAQPKGEKNNEVALSAPSAENPDQPNGQTQAPAAEAEEVPSDWFVPKVFKSSKTQE